MSSGVPAMDAAPLRPSAEQLSYGGGMADHTIKMRVPSIELDGRDVVFEVVIDGMKRGQLQVSEGGVDWYPRNAQTPWKRTWAQLADLMEG